MRPEDEAKDEAFQICSRECAGENVENHSRSDGADEPVSPRDESIQSLRVAQFATQHFLQIHRCCLSKKWKVRRSVTNDLEPFGGRHRRRSSSTAREQPRGSA